ncbi:MAG: citramalate synthase [Candidatus Hydrogenedens sp.]|nr:citramalate synthase [Candidatus Hydrogenedentota bacterium]NLF58618.1 citramalate synthase [Candidatus Hydrogenedens sp.]
MKPQKVEMYDTTLRDGAQGPGVKFSSDDQLQVVKALDLLGIRYIEGGQPGSNPKAVELFERARDLDLKTAEMAAFGSTRHPKSAVEDDPNIKALLDAGTRVVTIFAKTSALHVREILGVSLDENLKLIEESVAYLKAQGRAVFLDAEHYFDGYFEDRAYALSVLETSLRAGADAVILCETNGGRLPFEVEEATKAAVDRFPGAHVGIHTHNDAGCAVANALAAVRAGARQVQGTINGYGERTGNADLCTIIPNLQLKMGFDVLTADQLSRLTRKSHLVAELANMSPRDHAPYVGRDAFTHKGGMHADAVRKCKASYEHVNPSLVGNATRVAVSEVSGRSSLIQKAAELGIPLDRNDPSTKAVLAQVKRLENEGFEFEGADASLILLMRKAMGRFEPFFKTLGYHARVNQLSPGADPVSEATVKVSLPDGAQRHTVSEGHGPVDALNAALRKALQDTYPEITEVHLEDYKVRILDGKMATRAKTRVLIESSDTEESWSTVGVSENIITASYMALADSVEYKLMRARIKNGG